MLALVVAGCRTPGSPPGSPGGLAVERVGGYLEFVARHRDYEQDSKTGSGDTSSEETLFEESIRLDLDGYVYHPNLLEYSVGGLFGLLQEQFEDVFGERRRTSSDEGTIYEFDLRGTFLQRKPYPGTVYGRRYRVIQPRPFQPSLEVTTENYGVTWQLVDEKTPTNLQFSYTNVQLEPTSGDEPPGEQENMIFRFETAYRFNQHNVLSLIYNFDSVEEQPFELKYDTDELTLAHALSFGSAHQHRLDSELNIMEQRGSFNIDRLRWREVLRLEHDANLRSWYVFELLDRKQGNLAGVPPIEERSYLGTATLEHQLYESLITQLYGFGHYQDFKDGLEICRYGGQLSLDYRKNNDWGRLLAAYRARFEQEERTGGDQLIEILDERHTFRDPDPVVLANPNVDISSIFVTAEDRVTRYILGRDFTVRQVGERVELERLPTGFIVDGQTVLVDYVFAIAGNFTLDTIDQNLAIRQEFAFGLAPYYRLRRQEQTVSPEDARGVIPDDITAHLVGLEYRRGPLMLQGEFEDYDSTINPFRAVRWNAGLLHRFENGGTATLKTRWARIDRLPPDDRETRFFSVEGRYRHPITRSFIVEAAALYRNERDSLTGRDEGVDVDLSLEWNVRQTDVRMTYEYGKFDDDFTRNENSALFVQIRRRF